MDRRTFLTGSLGLAAALAVVPRTISAAQATPDATPSASGLPTLTLTLTDTGFEIAQPVMAGRYELTVVNGGSITDSHFGVGKIPDTVTDAQYDEWLAGFGEDTEALSFDTIEFIGAPDWPKPGQSVTGVVDIAPGRTFLFYPLLDLEPTTIMVEGALEPAPEPASDLTVTLKEMEFILPETAFTSDAVRWKIENAGAISHEIAILPIPADFTEEDFQILLSLDEAATPPPGVPEFDYQPLTAIGILSPSHTSWLDVHLTPGHYLAVCMLPFGTGYPHAMDGMYHFFDVK
jgi:hypothetical protein